MNDDLGLASMICNFRTQNRKSCSQNCEYHSSCRDVVLMEALVSKLDAIAEIARDQSMDTLARIREHLRRAGYEMGAE